MESKIAHQYLVGRPLEILADIVPWQYTLKGGTKAAIEHVVKAMSEGAVWAIELDVEDCYPSFDCKKLPSLIPLPKEVSEHVIVSEYLHLVPGNIGYHFGTTGDDDPGLPYELEKTLVDARQGIPQGSAASPLVAETMLAIALRQIPDGVGHCVAYGDNCLVMAKEEGDVVQIVKALGGALEHHPAERFWPKIKFFRPGETINFLGHSFTLQAEGKIRITPSPKSREKFEATVTAGLRHLQFSKLGKRALKRRHRELNRYVRSWAAAFSLCEGIDEVRTFWLKKIAKAC